MFSIHIQDVYGCTYVIYIYIYIYYIILYYIILYYDRYEWCADMISIVLPVGTQPQTVQVPAFPVDTGWLTNRQETSCRIEEGWPRSWSISPINSTTWFRWNQYVTQTIPQNLSKPQIANDHPLVTAAQTPGPAARPHVSRANNFSLSFSKRSATRCGSNLEVPRARSCKACRSM